jgi:hypothetical protein
LIKTLEKRLNLGVALVSVKENKLPEEVTCNSSEENVVTRASVSLEVE